MNVWVLKLINILSGAFVLHQFRCEVLDRKNVAEKDDPALFYINWFLLILVNVSECVLIQVRTEELRPRYDRNDPSVSFSRCTVLYFVYICLVACFIFWKQIIFEVAGEVIHIKWIDLKWDPDFVIYELMRGVFLALGIGFWLATTTILALPDNDDEPRNVLPFRVQVLPAAAA